MTTYANWGDLVGRYKQLTTLGGDVEVNSHYIHYAEKELESRFAPYFTVPFSTDNLTVKDLAIDLTYVRYLEGTGDKKADTKRKTIMDMIDKLIAGDMAMITTTSGSTIQTSGEPAYSSTEDYAPTFGHGPIEDMVVDQDLLDDEESARG